MAELYGRSPVYHLTNISFVIFTIACALSLSLNMLITFRFLQGTVGSAAIALGGGTVADVFIQEEWGKAIALWAMCPLLGPVVGPIMGGFLSASLGWRWDFWVLAIMVSLGSCSDLLLLRALRPNSSGRCCPGRLFFLRPRDLLCSNLTTWDDASPKGAEKPSSSFKNGLWAFFEGRISAGHHSPVKNACILSNCRRSLHTFGCRLWLHSSGLHDHNKHLREQLPLFDWCRRSHLS